MLLSRYRQLAVPAGQCYAFSAIWKQGAFLLALFEQKLRRWKVDCQVCLLHIALMSYMKEYG